MKIKPYIHPMIQLFLSENNMYDLPIDKYRPTHIIFPDIMIEHIKEFKKKLQEKLINYNICFAKKANPAKVFLRTALEQKIGIDVASKNELQDALHSGFLGDVIHCNGPKDDIFIKLAIKNNCVISCESIKELERIILFGSKNKNIRILLRISDPRISYGNIVLKDSRFGILLKDLEKCYTLLIKNPNIQMSGFHIHRSETQQELKVEFVKEMLTQTMIARKRGLMPNIINMGGAFSPLHQTSNINDWNNYLYFLCNQLKAGLSSNCWRNDFYDLNIMQGQIYGIQTFKKKVYQNMFDKNYISRILESNFNGNSIADFINEAEIKFTIEPGYNLLEQAGITIIRVIDLKQIDNKYILTVNANSSNLSATFFESLIDPIHIPQEKNTNVKENILVYLFGNTCSEDDIIMRKPVLLNNIPEIGDIFIFINTAAYKSYFQDSNPIMQEKGKFYVAQNKNGWVLNDDY